MNRQSASRTSFGMLMLLVAMLLVACGGGEGDGDSSPTTAADQAVPTLPSRDATAQSTGEISEDDLTVVTPNLAGPEDATAGATATDLTGDAATIAGGTPDDQRREAGTPAAPAATASTPAGVSVATTTAQGSPQATATAVSENTVQPGSTPTSGGVFTTAGDGTGGSGQPGERSSNTGEPDASPAASPVAAVEVEGCEITDIPPFAGATTAYVTNDEIFFRQGPGTGCPAVYDVPLVVGQAVEVIGGPVSQAADGSIWLQVEVDGVPGWVSFEFVEPVEQEP